MSGMQAMRDRVMRVIGRNPTVRDFLNVTRRGRPREAIVGGPKEIADRLGEMVRRARLRRLCGGRHAHAGHVRGLREVRGAGAAAPRDLPEGLQGRDAAGEFGVAVAAARLVAGAGIGGSAMAGTDWQISGEYMESCNCDYLCPCIYTNPQARGDL